VTSPGGEDRRVSIEEHRADVVRRLLAAGLTPRLLTALLPQFRRLIEQLSSS
jgi:hypothetical protein